MAFIKNILQGFLGLKKDPNATTQDTAVIKAEDTNSGIAIVPNGTGAITAQVPDGTVAGGNARGINAVDFQKDRYAATQVATGNASAIIGGRFCTNTGNYSIIGGQESYVSGASSIVFGRVCTAQGDFSQAFGNNSLAQATNCFAAGEVCRATSNYSTVIGGQSNTASTNTHATVIGGYQNTSSGQYSVSGGYSNVASGQGSVALGYDNTASGNYSIALGNNNNCARNYSYAIGQNISFSNNGNYTLGVGLNHNLQGSACFSSGTSNTIANHTNNSAAIGYANQVNSIESFVCGSINQVNANNSFAFGKYAYTKYQGAFTHTNARFGTSSDAQCTQVVRIGQSTKISGGTFTISSDLIPSFTNQIWNVTIKYTAVVTSITGTATGVSVGDCKNEVLTIGFKRIAGTSSVVGLLNTVSTNQDSSMSTASFGVSAGASQEMKLDFTAPTFIGGGSVTTRVVAKVELTEVAY